MGISMEFNREDNVTMLKGQGFYCFLLEKSSTEKLYLLNGGMPIKLDHNDIEYYYSRMGNYAAIVQQFLGEYHRTLKSISKSIQAIGGNGNIHGCIVAIDSFNHVYLNPIDGTITPYYATSITEKYVYSDIQKLLQEQRQDLYIRFIELQTVEVTSKGTFLNNSALSEVSTELTQFIADTFMYKPSRLMRSLQYLTDVKVIRVWNDQLVNFNLNSAGNCLYD